MSSNPEMPLSGSSRGVNPAEHFGNNIPEYNFYTNLVFHRDLADELCSRLRNVISLRYDQSSWSIHYGIYSVLDTLKDMAPQHRLNDKGIYFTQFLRNRRLFEHVMVYLKAKHNSSYVELAPDLFDRLYGFTMICKGWTNSEWKDYVLESNPVQNESEVKELETIKKLESLDVQDQDDEDFQKLTNVFNVFLKGLFDPEDAYASDLIPQCRATIEDKSTVVFKGKNYRLLLREV
jgi:hypothetical protein